MGGEAEAIIKIPRMIHSDTDANADTSAYTNVSTRISRSSNAIVSRAFAQKPPAPLLPLQPEPAAEKSNTCLGIDDDARGCFGQEFGTTTNSDRRPMEPRTVL